MMNQDNPYAMNQTCKVCGEPAAGFHFGAFTCEGCKSFFGRSYNNLSSISDCKNNGECIINKKNRTACKACRLRKCLMVGMSKSGSRYGRRSNWFKIHCLLQEQQQQAAAAMAAHHNNQQQHQAAAAAAAAQQHGAHGLAGQKPPGGMSGVPPSSAAAAALGMLGHAGAYPGLYPPRTKEELMMLSLEEYAKHPAASPSVSSPDSHNSDSSVEVSVRGNPLLQLSGKHMESSAAPPQLRKDLPPFLPLPFPGLGSMPVMPPPAFLPPSHLLFPGYHPALYQHHQGLLKPSPEQQQQAVAAAAAVQHLFNASNAAPSRYAPIVTSAAATHNTLPLAMKLPAQEETTAPPSPKCDALNNNHIPNGSKTAADELTKRFYLDAVLKSQRTSPPPAATKLPAHSKHDHSISALVTPNSESGRERLKSRQSNEEDGLPDDDYVEAPNAHTQENDSDCGEEELVVSMTPPRSPTNERIGEEVAAVAAVAATVATLAQDNPIDLSMKTGSSVASSLSSKCSSTGSVQAIDSENEQEPEAMDVVAACSKESHTESSESSEHETLELQVGEENGDNESGNSNNVHHNNNNNDIVADKVATTEDIQLCSTKRKLTEVEATLAATASVKRLKLELEPMEKTVLKVSTAPLDLTTKV